MTKEEILKKYEREIEHWADEEYRYSDILMAMDEYGKQCFSEGIKQAHDVCMSIQNLETFTFDIEKRYSRYLKELENEKK